MSLTKVSYSMIEGAPINVKDFGAVGDGVTDDTAAIQACFDSLYKISVISYATVLNAKKYAKKIIFPAGEYLITQPVTFGETGKAIYWMTLEFQSASIVSTYNGGGTGAAFILQYPGNCRIVGLNIQAANSVALLVNNSSSCVYQLTQLGCTGFAALQLAGMQFDNNWTGLNFMQNVGIGGAEWSIYASYASGTIAPAGFAGFPINSFNSVWIANSKKGIYWEGGSDIKFDNVEHEGLFNATSPGDPTVTVFKNVGRLSLSEWYCEAFQNPAYTIAFENCENVDIQNVSLGSYYHTIRFKDCSSVNVRNLGNSPVVYEGTNERFIFDNIKVLAAAPRIAFQEVPGKIGYFKDLQIRNLLVRNQTDTVFISKMPFVTTSSVPQSENFVLNPRGLDALGNVTTTYFTCVNDGGNQQVSPLGYIESVCEIDNITNFPLFTFNIDTTKIATAKTTNVVFVVAWKNLNLPVGFTAVNESGAFNRPSMPFGGNIYGQFNLRYGNWILCYAMGTLDTADTNVDLVWNYNIIYPIGTKFLFGGVVVYPGMEIKLPVVQ